MRNTIVILIISIFIYGCKSINEDDYFNGRIKVINADVMMKSLVCSKIEMDQPLFGVYVYDSLLINLTSSNDFNFNIINLHTKENIGYFCHKGKAGDEILATIPVSHVFKENEELKTILVDPNKKRLYQWNISKSIQQKSTIFDTIIPFRSLSTHHRPYDYFKYINDSTLITYTQTCLVDVSQTEPSLPFIEFRALKNDSLYKVMNVFKKTFKNSKSIANMSAAEYNEITPSDRFYSSRTCMRPDHLFVVQSMLYLGQLNLIDVKTGEITGIRIKGTPDFSIFMKAKKMENFYFCGGLYATNDKIFAGYSGEKRKRSENIRYIYVFDWFGNLLTIYDIGMFVDEFLYDEKNNKFYCLRYSDEKMFMFTID